MTENMKKLAEITVKEIENIARNGEKINQIDIRTKRTESILKLYLKRDNILEIPYENWGTDLDILPKRKMLVWSENLCNLLIEKINNDFLKKQLIYFSWNSKPVCTAYKSIINSFIDKTGKVLSETPVKGIDSNGIGTILFCEKSIVYVSPSAEISIYYHKEIRSAEIGYSNSLIFTYKNKKYEYKTSCWNADEINKSFDKKYIEKYLPDFYTLFNKKKYDQIIEQENKILQSNDIKDYFYLLMSYYLKNNYTDAIRVGKAGISIDTVNIELLDALAPPMIKSGMFNELIDIFEKTNDEFVGVESLYVFNFIGNLIIAYHAASRFEEELEFTEKYYFGDSKSADRRYYHNFACIFSHHKQNDKLFDCLKYAVQRGEDKDRIMNESDFANLRKNKDLLKKVLDYIEEFEKVNN